MPVYEYACNACENKFEVLHLNAASKAKVECPKCTQADVRRVLSSFSSPLPGSNPEGFCPPNGCGGCCGDPSSCMN